MREKAKEDDDYLLFEMQEMEDSGLILSATRLQRRLYIGYNRARMLMDKFKESKQK